MEELRVGVVEDDTYEVAIVDFWRYVELRVSGRRELAKVLGNWEKKILWLKWVNF
jgi:hypothetical protein